ncbi:NAD binding domain of 6-phosphogluconate dehydrogenase [Stachybotrys elegans]|uniref:NAD binding domain of 6-phosphogluconate dehydrogenase n=1 Tax=Stachybotrys elegans TaxID=80388 RepID=A0A8K0SY59_9HYPO|nr:NAD binding domain of 6-phosphogluconate dehydrogenase [Stachybotrys elegans]
MAMNLQKHLAGSHIRYFNRTLSRGDDLKEAGGIPANSVKDVVDESDVVFISLSDDAALNATIDAALQGNLQGKIIVDTSTVHPNTSAAVDARIAERGGRFIAAPVFGASPVAAAGKLLWIVAGPDDAFQTISPFIEGVMGRAVIRVGEDVRKASLMKTAGNFLTAGMMELVAEAHTLVEKTGLGSEALESLIEQQYGPLTLSMSQRLTTGAYMPAPGQRPWSDVKLALKDVGHGLSCAEEAGVKLEVGEVALRHLKEADRYGDELGRGMDSSSLYGVIRTESGLPFETEVVTKRDADQEMKKP